MIKLFLVFLVVLGNLISCSTTSYQPLREFNKQKDCSVQSLKYFDSKSHKTKNTIDINKLKEILTELSHPVKECFQQEIDTERAKSTNLCLVVGYDKSGKQEFFQLSERKKPVSGEFGKCLNRLRNSKVLKNNHLEDVHVLQPYRLHAPI